MQSAVRQRSSAQPAKSLLPHPDSVEAPSIKNETSIHRIAPVESQPKSKHISDVRKQLVKFKFGEHNNSYEGYSEEELREDRMFYKNLAEKCNVKKVA